MKKKKKTNCEIIISYCTNKIWKFPFDCHTMSTVLYLLCDFSVLENQNIHIS